MHSTPIQQMADKELPTELLIALGLYIIKSDGAKVSIFSTIHHSLQVLSNLHNVFLNNIEAIGQWHL